MQFSEWAAPIVPVAKKDGSLRICGDYKVTANQAALVDAYPLPRIEDLFASLSGGTTFTKLDLAHAYLQFPLDNSSKPLTTINTHRGLFQYNRLPFGISAAPAICQRTMDSLMQGLHHVCAYLDDILVTGSTEEEHLKNLDAVLERLEKAGIKLKLSKCTFLQEKVEYLGHQISADGLQPTKEKVRAVKEAPVPSDVTQLKSFLGLLNYYAKFLPNLSNVLAPLHSLLKKPHKWSWSSKQQEAFDTAKHLLTSDCLLAHYSPDKDLILACDASPYGVGAILSHVMDGQERPVAFTSRTLAAAEKNYSQLDKEALAIIFGVKKFHRYLAGRKFCIFSDHRPLQYLLGERNAIPAMASARVQRWALTLSAYDYQIVYKPGSKHANADSLSRLPLPEEPVEVPIPGETILVMETLDSSSITSCQIRLWTDRDPVLSQVRDKLMAGWQDTTDETLVPYQRRHAELSVHTGCVMWGSRVIIPTVGRKAVLDQLHEGHPGVSRMKSLARSYVWWPQMDKEIEERVAMCNMCQERRHLPPAAPLHVWEWPQRPWVRLHADYAGPFLGHMFLIIVDAHSKWIDMKPVANATTETTIEQFRSVFATHGIPEMLVTDNGSVFTSDVFRKFVKANGIDHRRSAPYHPSTNGLAERAVQTFKEAMKSNIQGSITARVTRFLLHYRSTPHSTTGVSPSELFMGRKIRTRLDLLKPNLNSRVQSKQQRQVAYHNQHAKHREFQVGGHVQVRDFSVTPNRWIEGVVIAKRGPLSYMVRLKDGREVLRHVDHVCARATPSEPLDNDVSEESDQGDMLVSHPAIVDRSDNQVSAQEQPTVRRSTRSRHPPDRFGMS